MRILEEIIESISSIEENWMNSSSRWSNVKGVPFYFDLIQLISIKRLHPSGRAKPESFGAHISTLFCVE